VAERAVKAERVPKPPLLELGIGAAWLVGVAAGLQIIKQVFGVAALGTPIFGAVLLDLVAGRAGVRWDEDTVEEKPYPWERALMRAALGAGIALVTGGLVVAVAVPAGWLHGHGEGIHPVLALLLALVRAVAVAVRDELLYRGIPLGTASRARLPAPVGRVFAALAGAAAIALVPGVTAAALAMEAAAGWLFASLWERGRGAWAAVGAHAAWVLLMGSALHGGLADLDWTSGSVAIDASSSGPPAWLAATLLAAAGTAVLMRWKARA
jgi:membrane protease YdiL (CAAX protease family)